ncbi:MAG: RHS repeat-associated core domain-containing protein [Verrucomicrobiota bacterium]
MFATLLVITDTYSYIYVTDRDLLAYLSAPGHTISYSYDINRDLMTIVDNQLPGSSMSKYVYAHDALDRRVSREQSGSMQAYSPAGGKRPTGVGSAGVVGGLLKEGSFYPLYDANGNIMQKLDGSSSVVMNVDYDPFGNIISGTLVGEYGFSTKPLVDGPDWYYYGFRYYDPVTGRWPSRDPIGELGGRNIYSFVYNSPINYIDVHGLAGWSSFWKGWEIGEKIQDILDFFSGDDDCREGAVVEGIDVSYNCDLVCDCCVASSSGQRSNFREQYIFYATQDEECINSKWTVTNVKITDDSNCTCKSSSDCNLVSRKDDEPRATE